MIPYLYAIDETFGPAEFEVLREYAHLLDYQDQLGPDGVTYVGIGTPVPRAVQERLTHTFSWLLGQRAVLKICAFRLTVEGTRVPQWAHSDAQVSRFAAFTYINPGNGGTVLLRHRETGMFLHPQDADELATWERDKNEVGAWEIIGAVDCAPNRTVIMRAELLHAAMPPDGFGTSAQDGRLILWSFFD